ncbi:hypothetical protein LTS18_000711 [Coniosporium uncinatum]|uniref:Uncharacterized protein n=1 Tax=Coniosporium uncinatum TaxID=93489 RepID=A0ACC3CUH0_9PEZI|nr:hypothetical protein LTS18_000711 [Coniosporium uncinatum]
MICRPSIAQEVIEMDAVIKAETQREREEVKKKQKGGKSGANGDVAMSGTEEQEEGAVKEQVNGTSESSPDKEIPIKSEGEIEDAEMKTAMSPPAEETPVPNGTAPAPPKDPWHPVLKPLIERLRSALPSEFEETLPLSFYVSFWQASIQDFGVAPGYEEEIKKLNAKVQLINNDRTDVSRLGQARKETQKKEVHNALNKLRSEMKTQLERHIAFVSRLRKEKTYWFAEYPIAEQKALHGAIIQECFFPRMLLSPLDASYSCKMLFQLHSMGTPGFRISMLVDEFMKEKQLTGMVF